MALMWGVGPFLAGVCAFALVARWRPVVVRRPGLPLRGLATELALALGCGIVFAVLAGFYLPRHFLVGGDYGEVDFAGYCRSLGSIRDAAPAEWRVKHSAVVGVLLEGPTRAVGILGALTGGALVSAGVYGIGLYLWARIAGGRTAGLAAVLFATANQSICWIARSPSFYPEVVALGVLGTAAVAAAVRWRTTPALCVGGVGAGMVLAADVRCFTVGVWCMAVLAALVVAAPVRKWPQRLLAVVLPVAASWWLAHLAHLRAAGDVAVPGAVQQGLGFLLDVPGYSPDTVPFAEVVRSDFAWGVQAPWRIPGALATLRSLTGGLPPLTGGVTEAAARHAYLTPWLLPLTLAAIASLGVLRRHRWAWLSAVLLMPPFAANLYLVFHTLARSSYYPLGMSIVPVLLGLGVSGLAGRRWRPRVAVAFVAWLLLSVTGAVPGFLSPLARWRVPDMAHNRVYDARARATGGTPAPGLISEWPNGEDAAACVDALAFDVAAGRTGIPFADVPRRVPPDRPPLGILPTAR